MHVRTIRGGGACLGSSYYTVWIARSETNLGKDGEWRSRNVVRSGWFCWSRWLRIVSQFARTQIFLDFYAHSEARFGRYQAEADHAGLERTFGLLAAFPGNGVAADELFGGLRVERRQGWADSGAWPLAPET
jgi:hypothetical protein